MNSTISEKKSDGRRYSKYSCSTRRKSAEQCDGKYTSDPVVGEFVFNYILNMLNAQKRFSSIASPEELQYSLLRGDAFSDVKGIEEDGLLDLYSTLSSGRIKGEVFGRKAKIKPHSGSESKLSKLRKEKIKLERALDRLTNLYLYSEQAMAESEFIIQKAKLVDSLNEVLEQIGFATSDSWQQSISDEEFIDQASRFILTQKLTDRNYVSFTGLSKSVGLEVLRSFLESVIDNIVMYSGHVKTITFRNGLSHTFIYQNKPED